MKFRDSSSPWLFRCCFCRFGRRWKKATRIATNTSLRGVRMWCTCTTSHLQLRGACKARGIPWTAVAEPYPRGLCRMLAAAIATAAGWTLKGKLDIAGCARSDSLRIGHAKTSYFQPRACLFLPQAGVKTQSLSLHSSSRDPHGVSLAGVEGSSRATQLEAGHYKLWFDLHLVVL